LLEDGPVGALMYVPTTINSYTSGVFSLCSPNFATSFALINHAVLIVGMDANKNYIIKNSWGTGWGDSGYGVIDATNDCALTAWVYALSWGYQIVGSTLLLFLGLIFALI
jgi:cathepsin L